MIEQPPQNPAGEYVCPKRLTNGLKHELIEQLENVPSRASEQVSGLGDSQLDTKYRNWTIRQIIHHLADSHMNCYVRFKWALTESTPEIKAYDESRWSQLVDAKKLPVASSLTILEGVHQRWAGMLRLLSDEQFDLAFFHPELGKAVTLAQALPSYVWHSDHHLAQIEWVRNHHGWKN